MSNTVPSLVVGVDFGTTGTAVAYAKPVENKVYHLMDWPGTDDELKKYDKVPSMVAFDGNNMEAWGFGVLGLKIESITNFESYKLFKPLFNSQDSSDSSEAERCVRIFLKALYQYLKEALRDHLPDQTWDQSKVKFLFSYPTTWDEETQARFSAVVKEAGYQAIEEQLSMTSLDEAEASMMYFFSSAREDTLPKPGEHVLMADVGGGTSDISIYEVSGLEGRQPKLVRVVCDEGKYIGSTQVDEQCKNKLRPKVEDICRQRLQEIPNAQQLDEYAMEKFVDAAVLHIEQNPVYTSHKHRYGKKAVDGRLQRAEFELLFLDPAEPEAGKVSTKTSIPIRIHREEFFEDAFRDQCAKIWDQCKSQMERLKAGQTVKHVVLSGGFGSSPYVMAKLSEKFTEYAKSQKADPPKVRQIADAQIAVCQGLVYDELRNIHGTGLWVYPAAASYGIRKAGKQDGIKWFLKKGDEVKVPHDVNIERHVNIDQSGKAGVLDFKIVKIERPPPTGFVMKTTEKAEWSQHAVPIKDISDWVKESLSGDLKGRLLLPKKAVLTITAKMFRDTIALTLHQANREPSRALYVHEPWHKAPKVNAGRAKAPKLKAWKFNLSKDQMIGLGALAFGAISAIYAVVAVHKGESQSKESQPKKSPPEESQPEESQRPLDKDVKSEETRGGDSEQENTSYDHFAVTTPGDSGLNAADMITTVDEPMMNNQYVFQTGNN